MCNLGHCVYLNLSTALLKHENINQMAFSLLLVAITSFCTNVLMFISNLKTVYIRS